jgi:stearoyl-CoA desaturase (delta-9 desaturase)
MFKRFVNVIKNSHILMSVIRWIDSDAYPEETKMQKGGRVDWFRVMPLIGVHLMCLGPIIWGWSWVAVNTAIALYLIRIFAITAFYHRYFSHRAFKTNRVFQFIFAAMGASAMQRGPLWWAALHRHHHRYSDKPEDFHSPSRQGFLWAHIGWFTAHDLFKTRYEYVRDWEKYPELKWLNRFDALMPVILAIVLYISGKIMEVYAPALGTSGPQMVVWGFFISSVAVLHATFCINSLDHMLGSKRYDTWDTSRNNWILAIFLLGEGWHNNHHHYAISTRNGFFWWEIDITYYLLYLLSLFGIAKDLRPVPENVLNSNRIDM